MSVALTMYEHDETRERVVVVGGEDRHTAYDHNPSYRYMPTIRPSPGNPAGYAYLPKE